jgi:teichuronic acid biosynthesis glycosyltransferase TuaC
MESMPGPGAPLRILSLSTEFPNPSEPAKGLFVRARLQAMAAAAHITVVAPVALVDYANPHGELFGALRLPRRRREPGLDVLHPRWLYPPYGGWTNAFAMFTRLWPLTARLHRQRRFDLIDAHFAHPEGIAGALLGSALGIPLIVTLRGSELRYRRARGKRYWMGWALRRAATVIAVSDGLRDLALELGVDPRLARTIPNGVDAGTFFPRDRAACRSAHRIDKDERVVLSAGDLAELKGHHRVICALAALARAGTSARLIIAGGIGRSGRYAESLRRLAVERGMNDRVQFAGEVRQEVLAELMTAADVFCLASSTEGWPNVVNEALACGTPIVATDVGAVRQMVSSARYGRVVPFGDDEALIRALQTALNCDWDRTAIAERGRSRTWQQVGEEVLEQARRVVEREHQGRG